MDNLPNQQASTPAPQVYIPSSPFYKRKAFWIFILILILIPLGSYGYKNKFVKTPPLLSQNPPSLSPQLLKLACPVPKEYCHQGKLTSFNNHPAIGFSIPAGTKIITVAQIENFSKFTSLDKGKVQNIEFFQTFIFSDSCHTITYIFPQDAQIRKFDLLPLARGELVATSSAGLITSDKQQVNLILQLQKRALDPNTLGQPNFKRCNAVNINPKDIGEFQSIDLSLFE